MKSPPKFKQPPFGRAGSRFQQALMPHALTIPPSIKLHFFIISILVQNRHLARFFALK